MEPPDSLLLRWNSFEINAQDSFKNLRGDSEFCDVTLACDGKQVKGHKVILTASSFFFQQILRENPHPHPLIYLKGVKYEYLLSLLDFIYTGEANIVQDDLDSFLNTAKDLSVKGLMDNKESSGTSDKQSVSLPSADSLQNQFPFSKKKSGPQPKVSLHLRDTPSQNKVSKSIYKEDQNVTPLPGNLKDELSEGTIEVEPNHTENMDMKTDTPNGTENMDMKTDFLNIEDTSHFNDTENLDIKTDTPNDTENMDMKTDFLNTEDTSHFNDTENLDIKTEIPNTEELSHLNDTENIDIKTAVPNTDEPSDPFENNEGSFSERMIPTCDINVTEQDDNITKGEELSHYWRKEGQDYDVNKELNHSIFSSKGSANVCSVCGKLCSRNSVLKCHMRVHTGEKPFECVICPKKFATSSRLKTHTRIHTGETFDCSTCSQKFTDSGKLERHTRIHTGEKPFQCLYCLMRFSRSDHLNRHMVKCSVEN